MLPRSPRPTDEHSVGELCRHYLLRERHSRAAHRMVTASVLSRSCGDFAVSSTVRAGRVSRQTVGDAAFGIGVCGAGGRFLAISRSLARLLQEPASEIVGLS